MPSLPSGGVAFRLWAPGAEEVEWVDGSHRVAMHARKDGWFSLQVDSARPGTRYAFHIDGGLTVPDPASRFNPNDVHTLSEVIDPQAYAWQDGRWRGRPWHEAVIYELHVGTFTPEGTWQAATGQLAELAAAGITVIEMMPVGEFAGRFGWGYDVVGLFAPYHHYGTPDDLRRLVDTVDNLERAVKAAKDGGSRSGSLLLLCHSA